jgi:hypothetical protein
MGKLQETLQKSTLSKRSLKNGISISKFKRKFHPKFLAKKNQLIFKNFSRTMLLEKIPSLFIKIPQKLI